jgi:hypothetical protein
VVPACNPSPREAEVEESNPESHNRTTDFTLSTYWVRASVYSREQTNRWRRCSSASVDGDSSRGWPWLPFLAPATSCATGCGVAIGTGASGPGEGPSVGWEREMETFLLTGALQVSRLPAQRGRGSESPRRGVAVLVVQTLGLLLQFTRPHSAVGPGRVGLGK